MTAQFQFVMRSGPTPGKIYPLEGPELTVGRDTTCDISINDAEISRKHATITLQVPGYVLEDLGSTNGTFVNGQRLGSPCLLKGGEMIAFGENVVLMYEQILDPNATMLSSSAKAAKVAAAKRTATPAPPPPAPVAAPEPVPSYAGQVPPGPGLGAAETPKKKGMAPWLIVGIVVLVLICVCVGIPVILEATDSWCAPVIKIFTNIIAPMLGYSTCP